MSGSHCVGHLNSFYKPKKGNIVIGFVERRNVDDWLVDIGYSHSAILPQLAFDGVTKKNAPKFNRGEVVVAFVEEVPENGEVLLSCLSRTPNEKLGRVLGGNILRCRPEDMNKIAEYEFQQKISQKSPLTVAKGENGRMWVDTGNPATSVMVTHAITTALGSEDPLSTFDQLLEQIQF